MKGIRNITFTGIDKNTPLHCLQSLAGRAEFAILYSATPEGRNRYPEFDWIESSLAYLQSINVAAAVHICGSQARSQLEEGHLWWMLEKVGRIQVNGPVKVATIELICQRYPDIEFITQHNERSEYSRLLGVEAGNHSVLVDASGGRGIRPDKWVAPETGKKVGFAGGLGADNLALELVEIAKVAGSGTWIDMEQSLRDENDWFSIDRMFDCFEIFRHYRHLQEI